MTDFTADLVALSLLPVSTWRDASAWLRAGDGPAAVLDRLSAHRLGFEPHERASLTTRAEETLARGRACGLVPVSWNDVSYPPPLSAIVDPPPVLWTRGWLDALALPAVAIVGSRAASPYALEVAERLAADLAVCGVAVVSGLARGVDGAAHRGAVSAGGSTIAVLGCGADVIYPAEHGRLAHSIESRGVIISELAPGAPPLPQFFPQRNRIISGLARAVVIVEAGEKSGSLITARCALEQGRDVLAVPGNVLSGRNRGGHALLRDGAKIVETADDIFEELGMPGKEAVPLFSDTERKRGTSPFRDPILECLPAGDACDLDEIAERSGLPSARLLPRLFELELRGDVARVGGGRFVRVDRSC